MTIEEIQRKYIESVARADEICNAELRQWLKDRGLDDKVKRYDGKIGWLDIDIYHRINFYLVKKDGTRSLHPCGNFHYSQIEEHFQPYKEDEE